ncbi:hypothetical protein QJS10_CPB17g01049 [Acorus calamus]|uniref:Uncharacterized protein n=1 Tax=Acorus calamus TaxID=4465 RepID=A0AAV9CVB6_ACOCL|nr:hypothetical protein QJS10_CPB17g01049 [Acorus calamus]
MMMVFLGKIWSTVRSMWPELLASFTARIGGPCQSDGGPSGPHRRAMDLIEAGGGSRQAGVDAGSGSRQEGGFFDGDEILGRNVKENGVLHRRFELPKLRAVRGRERSKGEKFREITIEIRRTKCDGRERIHRDENRKDLRKDGVKAAYGFYMVVDMRG